MIQNIPAASPYYFLNVEESCYAVLYFEDLGRKEDLFPIVCTANALIIDQQEPNAEWKCKLYWIGDEKPRLFINGQEYEKYLVKEKSMLDSWFQRLFIKVKERTTTLPNGWKCSTFTMANMPSPKETTHLYSIGIYNSLDEEMELLFFSLSSKIENDPIHTNVFTTRTIIIDSEKFLKPELPRKNIIMRFTQLHYQQCLYACAFTYGYKRMYSKESNLAEGLKMYEKKELEFLTLFPPFFIFSVLGMKEEEEKTLLNIVEEIEFIYYHFLEPNVPRIEEYYSFWKESIEEAKKFNIQSIASLISHDIKSRQFKELSVRALIDDLTMVSFVYQEPELVSHIVKLSSLLYQWKTEHLKPTSELSFELILSLQ